MVSTAMLSLKKLTHTSKTNNLPNNLSEIASSFSIMQTVHPRLRKAGRDEVIKIVRLRYVKDSFHEGPIVYNISYFPKKFSFLLKCNFEEESLTGALTRNHVERHHLEKNIDAVLLEGKIARILGVEEKSLGILISAVCQEADRKHVMEYTLSYYPSKRNKFVLKINV